MVEEDNSCGHYTNASFGFHQEFSAQSISEIHVRSVLVAMILNLIRFFFMGLGSFSFLSPLVIVVSSVPSMLFFVHMYLSYIYSRFLFHCFFHPFLLLFISLSLSFLSTLSFSPDSVW